MTMPFTSDLGHSSKLIVNLELDRRPRGYRPADQLREQHNRLGRDRRRNQIALLERPAKLRAFDPGETK
jgi:hypothetical protein